MHETGKNSPNSLQRAGKTLRRGLGAATVPAMAVLALVPAVVSAATPPKPESNTTVQRIIKYRISHLMPVTACLTGEATMRVNVDSGGAKYDSQSSTGGSTPNTVPTSQAVVAPLIVSRFNPNGVALATTDFGNGNYAAVGLQRSTDPSVVPQPEAYPTSSTTSFNIDPTECAPVVFTRYADGATDFNEAKVVPLGSQATSLAGAFGGPPLAGPVGLISSLP